MDGELKAKQLRLWEILESIPSAAVAYSGGVDSTLLSHLARQAMGDRMLAVLISSPLMPPRETERAIRISGELGFPLQVAESNELTLEGFPDNPRDRCYLCKKHRLILLRSLASSRGLEAIMDGGNADDALVYRPGRRAAREEGCLSPLEEAGFTKRDIRLLARELGLPNWNAPSRPCLATRFPYGARLSREAIWRVDAAEEFLEGLGWHEFRVRLEGPEWARIEAGEEETSSLARGENRSTTERKFRELGFRRLDLDLEGYRSGSMDRGGQRRKVLTIFRDGEGDVSSFSPPDV
ncbi:ATP-dependent sacrificial sulfur transferase LarE [Candidatus Solincola tengchongensis]|uniref:ATP-dependent sacrificial sulfur transferase LarE n=1 Tax=Candidatus Solincola tengchongensis TaxID=2900693 RepID=UPI002580B381|nr:ATP-dependent sacrificial sulfur transferase LarE [Candidatus Solincola tengchongensis]